MIAQFFAAVLIAGANERLEGGSPTLGSAFRKASTRSTSIFGWAIINSTVGLILQAIRERAGFLGVIVTSLIGAAWNVITWLAVPIIIVEGVGPIVAIKRSALLLKQTWGENLIAQIGFGLIGFLVTLPGWLILGGLSFLLPIVFIPLLIVYLAVVGSVLAALSAIYRTALYRFAVGLPTGDTFDQQALARRLPRQGRRRLAVPALTDLRLPPPDEPPRRHRPAPCGEPGAAASAETAGRPRLAFRP